MSSRRGFIGALAVAALPTFRPEALRRVWDLPRSGAGGPDDEDFWIEIQRAFDADRTMVNLNNGGCSPCPTHVLDQMIRDLRFSNELPVIHMWQTLEPRIESVRRDLAREFGCDPEEGHNVPSGVPGIPVGRPIGLAKPQSTMSVSPKGPSMMFPGFSSR